MVLEKNICYILLCIVIMQFSCKGGERKAFKDESVSNFADNAIQDTLFDPSIFDPLFENTRVDSPPLELQTINLDKVYMMQVHYTLVSPAPEFSATKSRIIKFVKNEENNAVYMVESAAGLSVESETSELVILAKFAILNSSEMKDDENIGILKLDFNNGMKVLYSSPSYYISGFEVGAWTSQDLQNSFVKSVSYSDTKEKFKIRQVAQVTYQKEDDFGSESSAPVAIDYFFQPYNPDSGFLPLTSIDKDHAGFFEVGPVIKQGGGDSTANSMRYHLPTDNKEIIYVISENTPQEYVPAITEGILYWNKAFGEEVIKIIPASECSDWEKICNIVQWIDYRDAGFAYADFQADPKTGQILRSRIFLPSYWVTGTLSASRYYLSAENSLSNSGIKDQISGFLNNKLTPGTENIAANSFSSLIANLNGLTELRSNRNRVSTKSLCSLDMKTAFADLIQTGINRVASPEAIKRAAEDYLREVVAHEVGHTLGLRHNFAGSLAANYSIDTYSALLNAYENSDTIPAGTVISSSVMDYLPFQDSSMVGAMIRKDMPVLSYDKEAIEVLYKGASKSSVTSLFCTDEHTASYLDCQPFDAGNDIFSYYAWAERQRREKLPYLLAEVFTDSKYPLSGFEPREIDDIEFDADMMAFNHMRGRLTILGGLLSNTSLVSVAREFDYVNSSNGTDYLAAENAALNTALTGKISEFFPTIPPTFSTTCTSRFTEIINGEYKTINVEGVDHTFSDQDITKMVTKATELCNALPKYYGFWDIAILGQGALAVSPTPLNLRPMEASYEFETFLGTKTSEIVTTLSSEAPIAAVVITPGIPDPENPGALPVPVETPVSLPKYLHFLNTRIVAANLSTGFRQPDDVVWGSRQPPVTFQSVFTNINSAAFGDALVADPILNVLLTQALWQDVTPQTFGNPATNWASENINLLFFLPQ